MTDTQNSTETQAVSAPKSHRSFSRAGLFRLGAGAIAAASVGGVAQALGAGGIAGGSHETRAGSQTAAGAGSAIDTHVVAGPRYLHFTTYKPLIGQKFRLSGHGHKPLTVELTSASRLPGRGEVFSLIFATHGKTSLTQETYQLVHPRLGTVHLFLVPVDHPAHGQHLQAIVNRISPTHA